MYISRKTEHVYEFHQFQNFSKSFETLVIGSPRIDLFIDIISLTQLTSKAEKLASTFWPLLYEVKL